MTGSDLRVVHFTGTIVDPRADDILITIEGEIRTSDTTRILALSAGLESSVEFEVVVPNPTSDAKRQKEGKEPRPLDTLDGERIQVTGL